MFLSACGTAMWAFYLHWYCDELEPQAAAVGPLGMEKLTVIAEIIRLRSTTEFDRASFDELVRLGNLKCMSDDRQQTREPAEARSVDQPVTSFTCSHLYHLPKCDHSTE
jgi:hypothetical protein